MEKSQGNWSTTILYYLAWLICCLLIVADILMIRQASVTTLSAIYAKRIEASAPGEKNANQINLSNQVTVIDEVVLFGGGVVAVALAIAVEYYFRMGQKKGMLVKRVGTVVGIELVLLLICFLIMTFV